MDAAVDKQKLTEPRVAGSHEAKLQRHQAAKQKQQQQHAAADNQNQTARKDLSPFKQFTIACLLYLIKTIISAYDLVTWPLYFVQQGVSRRRRQVEHLRSIKIEPNDPDSPWRQVDIEPLQIDIERQIDAHNTYDQLMKAAFERNASLPCYGLRQVVEERWVKRADSSDKLARQVRLSQFMWYTYQEFNEQIEAARRGFLRVGVRAGQKVILFADTRAEWQIVSQALLRLGAIVCTMYSTLGVDGIVHTCTQTESALVVTQRDKVERLLSIRDKLRCVKKIIYFDTSLYLPQGILGGQCDDNEWKQRQQDVQFNLKCAIQTQPDNSESNESQADVECMSFAKLLALGLQHTDEHLEEQNRSVLDKRTKDSLAVMMYTSGSTGIPKGVLISHKNILATLKAFTYVTKDFVHRPRENCCVAYLPLAHIFEFSIESIMLYHGVRFGFATPHTLTDKSPGLVPGETGDLGLLKPTVMIIVPLVLDRIVQGVKQALRNDSYFKEKFVTYLIDYKIYWQKRHYETPLVDKLVCSKIAQVLGGRAKYVICGSAPLSMQTQNFVRAALNVNLPQGYGATETCAATSCQLFDCQTTQNVGIPVSGALIKLEPWSEGNYRPDDKPNPRGEIVVGGDMISHGYFKLDDQTKEAFYVDKQGIRWYRTGDIGEFLPNGLLKIIDRKKDLVKLQNGEYISLGRVESTLKSNPYTDNFCVYANSNYNYIVALGAANEQAMKQLAQQIVVDYDRAIKMSPATAKRQGLPISREERENLLIKSHEDEIALLELREILMTYQSDCLNNNDTFSNNTKSLQTPTTTNVRLAQLCSNKLILDHVLDCIWKIARERNLLTLEIPKKLLLIPEEWTEDKNLVTAAMKIRRNYVYKRYERELKQIYASQGNQHGT